MAKVKVDSIGGYSCDCYIDALPRIVREFVEQTGADVEYTCFDPGRASGPDAPQHIRAAVESMRAGGQKPEFFINGSPVYVGAHNGPEMAQARKKLVEAAGLDPEPDTLKMSDRRLATWRAQGCDLDDCVVSDTHVKKVLVACAQFGHVRFFDSTIDRLDADCIVKELRYGGYDVVKVMQIVRQHPDLFADARLGKDGGPKRSSKADPGAIAVRLLGRAELDAGFHPCVITGGNLDTSHALHRAMVETYGGWGYVARDGERTCGFMGICVKSLAAEFLHGFNPQSATPDERTLLVTCVAGGGVFGGKYNRIGVASKLLTTIIRDARDRGYVCLEANPHDRGIAPLLEKHGFTRIEHRAAGTSAFGDAAFYRLLLADIPTDARNA